MLVCCVSVRSGGVGEVLVFWFVSWCGGWDLNPRRPTPAGLKPAPLTWLGHPRVAPVMVTLVWWGC